MTKFLDGPAKGQTLMLIQTPIFLRVTEKKEGPGASRWDALNIPGDKPLDGEILYAYLLVEHHGYAMIDGSKFRGRCAMASYAFIDAQPSQAIMWDSVAWARWVETAATLKSHIDKSTFIPR